MTWLPVYPIKNRGSFSAVQCRTSPFTAVFRRHSLRRRSTAKFRRWARQFSAVKIDVVFSSHYRPRPLAVFRSTNRPKFSASLTTAPHGSSQQWKSANILTNIRIDWAREIYWCNFQWLSAISRQLLSLTTITIKLQL